MWRGRSANEVESYIDDAAHFKHPILTSAQLGLLNLWNNQLKSFISGILDLDAGQNLSCPQIENLAGLGGRDAKLNFTQLK